ncbi:MAG TPA: VOC family protein [Geobacterales bacterium]|nr:VOC family protein [Geobacterales bacterium]
MYKIKEEVRIKEIELKVKNLEELIEFYVNILGFKVFNEKNDFAELGSGKDPFLRLVRAENLKDESYRSTGLYHVAYLLPSRKDLAIMLKHLLDSEAPIEGFADHLVSEAIYLRDLEGNGIEVYCDRPRDQWIRSGNKIAMSTEQLDVDSLLELSKGGDWKGFSEHGRIGHIHLKVSNLSKTEYFYTQVLSFDLTLRYYGAIFLSTGGYHHHIGANVWQSLNSGPRSEDMRGLSYFTIKLPNEQVFENIAQNIVKHNVWHIREKTELYTKDPDNIAIKIIA